MFIRTKPLFHFTDDDHSKPENIEFVRWMIREGKLTEILIDEKKNHINGGNIDIREASKKIK